MYYYEGHNAYVAGATRNFKGITMSWAGISIYSPCTRLEISGIASQFAIQNARFAIHNKLMHSKIANHLKKTISADIWTAETIPS